MAESTIVLRSDPGIKRDGTKFDGNFYTDGQWVRFQRGLPRKIEGHRAVQRYLTEVSRGITTSIEQNYVYCHSGGSTTLDRFTMDASANSSIITDRTPVNNFATATITLTGGASGSVDGITVDGVQIMSGSEPFDTDLSTTAANVAANITVFGTSPDYTATSVGAVITIQPALEGQQYNGFEVLATSTTITTTTTDMTGGTDALVESSYNQWMFDYQFDSSSNKNYIIAHVAPNAGAFSNSVGGQIFFGDVTGTSPLISVQLPPDANATGGIVSLHPYLFYYGSDGIIGWSVAGAPTDLTGTGSGLARVWGQKIIKGFPLRAGSGSAPAGIFWAIDAVIRATFTGGSTIFQFDTIASDTSIMSADSIVDYDGVFFWAGVDRFLMFNGVVREVPNQMNLNWFFDGLNKNQRSKVFAFKVSRYGEIWWCYPRGSATECTHAVIYNVRENTWYDTELPVNGRSAGHHDNFFAAPVLAGAIGTTGAYKVWLQEQGTDEIDGSTINPILSYFETADLSNLVQGNNKYMRISAIEPDFIQSGDMTVQITGRANARAQEVNSRMFTFPAVAAQPYEQIVVLKEQRRELRVRFESNAFNGDYQMGQIIGHIETGDGTMLG